MVTISLKEFVNFFPKSYCCGMIPTTGKQANGFLITTADALKLRIEYFQKNKWKVHFTPNTMLTAEGKNRKTNFCRINCWFVDVDIEETKHAKTPEDFALREAKKEELFTTIATAFPINSSFVCESRNGYHAYWLAAQEIPGFSAGPTPEGFAKIQKTLADFLGGDMSCARPTSMLPVMETLFWKWGETGKIKLESMVGTKAYHTEKLMLEMCVELNKRIARRPPNLTAKKPIERAAYIKKNSIKGIKGIKDRLSRLSGHPGIGGEVISFQSTGRQKYNLLFNGNSSPVWIDDQSGHIFSHTDGDIKSIESFLDWYNPTPEDKFDAIKLLNQ